MFGRTRKDVNAKLDEVVDAVLASMETHGPISPEYPKLMSALERVVKLQTSSDERKKLSPDTIATVVGYLVGILIIVAAEQNHVLGSKGMGFLPKLQK